MIDNLHMTQLILSLLAAFACSLLAFMFWNSSLTSGQHFTAMFLRLLSLASVFKAIEIVCASYHVFTVESLCFTFWGSVIGVAGRGIEVIGYFIIIVFLLRPETRKNLNGGVVPQE